jgi:hypothetical protein
VRACAGEAPRRLIHWRILFIVCWQPATPPFPSSTGDAVRFGEEVRRRCSISHEQVRTTAPLPDGRLLPAATHVWGRPPRRQPWMPLLALPTKQHIKVQSKYMQAVNRSRIRTKHIDDREGWVRLWFKLGTGWIGRSGPKPMRDTGEK